MARNSSLVGSVFERNALGQHKSPAPSASSASGFPVAQHRSRSAFARSRRDDGAGPSHSTEQPHASSSVSGKEDRGDAYDLDPDLQQISEGNQRRVDNMTEREREEARQEILGRFGPGIGDVLRKAREARERKARQNQPKENTLSSTITGEIKEKPPEVNRLASRSPEEIPLIPLSPQSLENLKFNILSGKSITRPSSRADRRLRFAELDPSDVHVYESAPPSPRRKIFALPPPPAEGIDPSIISLGELKASLPTTYSLASFPITSLNETLTSDGVDNAILTPKDEPLEEGTPEDIRRRFFPNAPTGDPSLEWLKFPSFSNDTSLRFDLNGNVIPSSLSFTLPTHLGLHHHAEGASAGYTIDDIFLLSRSTVPAQRVAMFGVLGQIARNLSKQGSEVSSEHIDLGGQQQEDNLRDRMLAAGMEAMNERGSVGARAIELIWLCMVEWKGSVSTKEAPLDITKFRLPEFLSTTATIFSQNALPDTSLYQLLVVLHIIAKHGGNDVCSSIMNTPQLVSCVVQTFLPVPGSASSDSISPKPEAIELLITLARASRANAEQLANGPVSSLLRFIALEFTTKPGIGCTVTLPLSHLTGLSVTLLTITLRLYTILASYGLYAHIAATATEYHNLLSPLILGLPARQAEGVRSAWFGLIEAWTICAVDPHRTIPVHDILWSQIVAWGWGHEVLEHCQILDVQKDNWTSWSAAWNAAAAWLEGSRINAVKGGEAERTTALSTVQPSFEGGNAKEVVECVIQEVKSRLADGEWRTKESLASVEVLTAAIRLWLSCLASEDSPPSYPPFFLPFSDISEFSSRLVKSPQSFPPILDISRSISTFLSVYLRLSRCLPAVSADLWLAQALAVLLRLAPGDETLAIEIVDSICTILTPSLLRSTGFVPSTLDDKFSMAIVKPFLLHSIRPDATVYVGPMHMTTESIQRSSTQDPTSLSSSNTGLPFRKDWTFSGLDHLLRSGNSAVFKTLPASWDASEVEVVRMSLIFTKVARQVLDRYGLMEVIPTREEVVFACMKVFMLEHEQQQHDSAEEVFRDGDVSHLMTEFLAPYVYDPKHNTESSSDLEQVSTRFLGSATPFYQWYQDFIALYDSVSFSNPLFARLLLPPTSLRYPVDYRKLLWHDYAHLLPTIKTPAEQTIVGDLKEYLYPIEKDSEILSAYLGALASGRLEGFIRLVSLHHVAGSIWPDMGDDDEFDEVNSERLLKALLSTANEETISDVMKYSQSTGGMIILPPKCFSASHVSRLEVVKGLAGDYVMRRLQGLYVG